MGTGSSKNNVICLVEQGDPSPDCTADGLIGVSKRELCMYAAAAVDTVCEVDICPCHGPCVLVQRTSFVSYCNLRGRCSEEEGGRVRVRVRRAVRKRDIDRKTRV